MLSWRTGRVLEETAVEVKGHEKLKTARKVSCSGNDAHISDCRVQMSADDGWRPNDDNNAGNAKLVLMQSQGAIGWRRSSAARDTR